MIECNIVIDNGKRQLESIETFMTSGYTWIPNPIHDFFCNRFFVETNNGCEMSMQDIIHALDKCYKVDAILFVNKSVGIRKMEKIVCDFKNIPSDYFVRTYNSNCVEIENKENILEELKKEIKRRVNLINEEGTFGTVMVTTNKNNDKKDYYFSIFKKK